MTKRLRVVVRGTVQGVGFRYATADAARRLRVAGQVRNLPDGAVEAELEGDDRDVDAVLAFLQDGPPAARVTGVSVEDLEPRGQTGFRVEA
jgi:acylphosphatase